jgi:hypothetical protein
VLGEALLALAATYQDIATACLGVPRPALPLRPLTCPLRRLACNGGGLPDHCRDLLVLRADLSPTEIAYGTRHPQGLLEFRKVEQKEIQEQERVRLDAQQFDRIAKTGQSELFGADEPLDLGVLSFEDERRENLESAEQALMACSGSE